MLMEATFPSIICCLCLNDQNVITDVESGEVICGNCGMVIIDKILVFQNGEHLQLKKKMKKQELEVLLF